MKGEFFDKAKSENSSIRGRGKGTDRGRGRGRVELATKVEEGMMDDGNLMGKVTQKRRFNVIIAGDTDC